VTGIPGYPLRDNAVIRRTIARFGGREVDRAGDGFLAASNWMKRAGQPGQGWRTRPLTREVVLPRYSVYSGQ
jgi:hypothetical protein